METKKIKRNLAVFGVLTVLTLGNYFRLSHVEGIRSVEIITLFVAGVMFCLTIMQVRLLTQSRKKDI